MKKKIRPYPKLLKDAQDIFNAHIRERDRELGCISCGGHIQHAGHYFSQGNHSAIRFGLPHTLAYHNTNGQCIRCNMHLHGNLIKYRQGLVKRYGEDYVKRLEEFAEMPENKKKKWSRDELKIIIETYK